MTKIMVPRFLLAPTSHTYSLETSVSRVDIDRRQVGTQLYRFVVVFQQNHVGGHTIDGWPAGVRFVNSRVPNPVPGSQTAYQFFTNDWGASWVVEVNRILTEQGAAQPPSDGSNVGNTTIGTWPTIDQINAGEVPPVAHLSWIMTDNWLEFHLI